MISEHLRVRTELPSPLTRLRELAAAQSDDVQAASLIGREVALADAATSDEADLWGRHRGHRRREVELRQLKARAASAGPHPIAINGIAQSSSSTVRPSDALNTAESTICWPTRAIAGESGPSMGAPESMQ